MRQAEDWENSQAQTKLTLEAHTAPSSLHTCIKCMHVYECVYMNTFTYVFIQASLSWAILTTSI